MTFSIFKQSITEDELQYFCGGKDIHMVLYSNFKRGFKVMGFGDNKNQAIYDFWNNLEIYSYEKYLSDCLKIITGNSVECCDRRIKKDKSKFLKIIQKYIKVLKEELK